MFQQLEHSSPSENCKSQDTHHHHIYALRFSKKLANATYGAIIMLIQLIVGYNANGRFSVDPLEPGLPHSMNDPDGSIRQMMLLGSDRTDRRNQSQRPVRLCADGDGKIAQAVPVYTGEPDAEPGARYH